MTKDPQKLQIVLKELKAEYLLSLPQKIQELSFWTNQEDYKALEDAYHKLKGTGKTYGFPEISVLAEQMEHLAVRNLSQKKLYFEKALIVMEKLKTSYEKNERFSLETDPEARTLLALKS
ncbi:MAG: Hpt domain-containing protein [Proteobacteria bacterium]|jgi:HPt (histidine-containing phosphotransfer) domain-containing protein|nr:Hpt domain-containing protein [Pseudomonadota bacterium]